MGIEQEYREALSIMENANREVDSIVSGGYGNVLSAATVRSHMRIAELYDEVRREYESETGQSGIVHPALFESGLSGVPIVLGLIAILGLAGTAAYITSRITRMKLELRRMENSILENPNIPDDLKRVAIADRKFGFGKAVVWGSVILGGVYLAGKVLER